MRFALLVFVVHCVSLVGGLPLRYCCAEPMERLDPTLDYRAEKRTPVTYDVDFSIVVTPPYHCKKLKVWLPIPQSDMGQHVSDSRLSTFPTDNEPQLTQEMTFGNRFAYWEFESPKGAQMVRHQFRIKVWELRWNVDTKKVATVTEWPTSFDRYRKSETQAVVFDSRFERLLGEIVPRGARPASGLENVLNWVQDNFAYDHDDASLAASSEHAFDKRHGHCSDYHGFCASLGRALGVPTRVTYGINPFPKNSPSHCKLEAFLPPYGWVSFDVSETQKLVAKIREASDLSVEDKRELVEKAQARLASGFRDNTWFVVTRGTDYELSPPGVKRVPVVRTAHVEADGVPLPDPDPANAKQTTYSWMTIHRYLPDRPVAYPFGDWRTLAN